LHLQPLKLALGMPQERKMQWQQPCIILKVETCKTHEILEDGTMIESGNNFSHLLVCLHSITHDKNGCKQ